MLADYHIHTDFSVDSCYPMEHAVIRGVNLGFDELCFTEHLDYFGHGKNQLVDYPGFFTEIERLRKKYEGQIVVKAGAEFGVQLGQIAKFEKVYDTYPFEFILLSNHQVNDLEFWTGDFQRGKEQRLYNREYYQAILLVIQKYRYYSVLGHLDMIKRYDPAGIWPDEDNEDIIKEILHTVIADGKGIEVNTSCYQYGLPDLTPSRKILSWYRELGGRIITIGSDTHEEDDLGYRIRETKKELLDLGFYEFTTFSRMEPLFHSLE